MKKSLLIVFGAVLVVMPWVFMLSSSAESDYSFSSVDVFGATERMGRRPNPKFSLWERMMCFGYRRAAYCPDKPLHPTEEVRRVLGLAPSGGEMPKRRTTMYLEDIVK